MAKITLRQIEGLENFDPNAVGSGGGAALVAEKSLNMLGPLVSIVGSAKWYPARNVILKAAYCSVGVVSSNQIIVDVKKNGVSVLAPSYLTIVGGAPKSNTKTLANIILTPADYLTVDIVSASSGENLTTTLVYL